VSVIGSVDAESVAAVLTEIAEIASETLELQEVFDRVATSVRRIIPFENMGVVRIIDDERAVLHASTVPCKAHTENCLGPIPLTSWSPRMRPRPGPNPRIEDAQVEFDPAFPIDARALEGGVRSAMWEPFRSTDTLRGGVWLAAYQPFSFTDEHQDLLRPIAALLGSAVEHWRIWDAERRRRERLERVEELLGTLAESLDVREIFQELSSGMQPILPHTTMVLTELDRKSGTIRVSAYAAEPDLEVPTHPVSLTEQELSRGIEFEIHRDIQADLAPDTERQRLILSSGMRSWLRVPVLLSGELNGGLSFFHLEPARFDQSDAEVARRLADRIALMLSHKRLAEQARVAAESRERAERLEARVETLAHELNSRESSRVVGISHSWKETLRQVERVTGSDTTVLITGESGTGKEVISKLIHQGSPRVRKPFVAINCAALPEQLLESELFGHEKGAFTGAIATKLGRIEQAEGGTLFLDEIAEMSPVVQAKFLRVLEEREFQRVGGTRTLKADVRVIAATNRDLGVSIARQQFREDLFYRLNVFQIHIDALRQRTEDILPLAEGFLEDLGRTMGRPAAGISRDAREWLLDYAWPGNVRELRNAIERAILLCDGGLITRDHLPAPMVRPGPVTLTTFAETGHRPGNGAANGAGNGATVHRDAITPQEWSEAVAARSSAPESVNIRAMERDFIEKALSQSRGNKSKAARLLGLTRAQLYWRLEKYNLS
jgi:transcriptional regulator with GAF, ATPase, and Fis domain